MTESGQTTLDGATVDVYAQVLVLYFYVPSTVRGSSLRSEIP